MEKNKMWWHVYGPNEIERILEIGMELGKSTSMLEAIIEAIPLDSFIEKEITNQLCLWMEYENLTSVVGNNY